LSSSITHGKVSQPSRRIELLKASDFYTEAHRL